MEKLIFEGVKVRCLDGEAGKVTGIVIDPQTRQPVYLVIKRHRLHPREVVVPVSLVADIQTERVELSVPRSALSGFPDYEVIVQQGEYHRPLVIGPHTHPNLIELFDNSGFMALRQRSVPEQSVKVSKGMAVKDSGGRPIGKVAGMVADARQRQITYIVLENTMPFSRPRLVAAELVEKVTDEEVYLRISRSYLRGLPVYVKGEAVPTYSFEKSEGFGDVIL